MKMNNTKYELLLNKNLNEIKINNIHPKPTSLSNNYFIISEQPIKFFNTFFNYLFIVTDENEKIINLKFHLETLIDKSFFNDLAEQYGNPDDIQVVESKKTLGITSSERWNSKKTFLKTRKGKFNEKPLYILWNKKNYQIKILLKHGKNKSEISFRKPTNRF